MHSGLPAVLLPLQAICLFPRAAPELVEATTRGMTVGASVIYAPEASSPINHLFSYWWVRACVRTLLLLLQFRAPLGVAC
jgi:hypothetical protein